MKATYNLKTTNKRHSHIAQNDPNVTLIRSLIRQNDQDSVLEGWNYRAGSNRRQCRRLVVESHVKSRPGHAEQ